MYTHNTHVYVSTHLVSQMFIIFLKLPHSLPSSSSSSSMLPPHSLQFFLQLTIFHMKLTAPYLMGRTEEGEVTEIQNSERYVPAAHVALFAAVITVHPHSHPTLTHSTLILTHSPHLIPQPTLTPPPHTLTSCLRWLIVIILTVNGSPSRVNDYHLEVHRYVCLLYKLPA